MTVVATVEVPAEDFLLGGVLSSNPHMQIELEPAVSLASSAALYVWVGGSTVETIDRAFRGAPEIQSFSVVETTDARSLVRVTWNEDPEFFDLVGEASGVILEATGTTDTWRIQFRFEAHGDLSAFFRECVQRGLSLDVRHIDNPGQSDSAGLDGELTDAQREAIRLAFEQGFFTVPRKITLQDLADELEISDTAASQRLRRGLTTLLSSRLCGLNETNGSPSRPVVSHREAAPTPE